MNFSFSAKGKTKAAVIDAVVVEMTKVVESQPVHANDKDRVEVTVATFINALVEPSDGEAVVVSVSGSLGWRDTEQKEFTSSNVSVGAYITTA